MEVADDGTLFVADRDNSKLFKISADLSTVTSVTVASAQDVALYEGKLYVSSYAGTASKIAVLNASDLSFVQDIDITTLDGSAYSRANSEGFAGIDIDSTGHLWLLDENYGSAPGGVVRDRLLVSSAVPEPSTLGLLVLGGSALLMRRRRAIL
jgi:hypothetical protein